MEMWKGALLVLGTAITVLWLPSLLQKRPTATVGGFVKPGWEKVEETFRKYVETGVHLGGSFAVYHRGEAVVNLFAGSADDEAFVPWRKDTLSPFFSSTKGVGAILIALLVDRGLLDYDQPVAKYWPEFAQKGKENITVRQLLSHQAGLIAFDEPVSIYSVKDEPEKVAAAAASATPIWKIGEGIGYHAMTIGIYVDALIRRIDPQHRNISQFYEEELQKPYDVDFHIGLPRGEHYRVARFYPIPPLKMLRGLIKHYGYLYVYIPYLLGLRENLLERTMTAIDLDGPGEPFNINRPLNREVPLASIYGFGTAEGLAKIWGILANQGVMKEKVLMKAETVRLLTEPVVGGPDKCASINMTYGVGTNLFPSPEGTLLAGHPGFGGQMGFMDPRYALAWAYVTNHETFPTNHDTYAALTATVYDVITTKPL